MQDSRAGNTKRYPLQWMALSLGSAAIYGFPVLPGMQLLGLGASAGVAQTVEDAEPAVLLEVEGSLEAGDHTLDDGSLYDEHTFAGHAGETISITLESLEFDTQLYFISPDGETLAENDDAGDGNYNSWLTVTLPVSGTYKILANAYDNWEQGRYLLTVASGLAEPAFSATALRQIEANRLNQKGRELASQGSFQEALSYFEQALAIYLEIGDRRGQSLSFNDIGYAHSYLGQYETALDFLHQSLVIHQEIGDLYREGLSLNNIGFVYVNLGQYYQALNYYQQALSIRQKLSDRRGEAEVLNSIGFIYDRLGQYSQALNYYEQSLVITREIGDRRGEAEVLNSIGHNYSRVGQYQEALNYYQQSIPIAQEVGHRLLEGGLLNNIGDIYERLEQYQEALTYYEQSLAIAQEISDRQGEGIEFNNIGGIYASLGRHQEALAYYQQALAIHQEIGDRSHEGASLANIGRLLEKQGQSEVAIVFLKQSVNVRESIRGDIRELSAELQQSYTNTIAADYRFLADLLLSQGRIIEAQQVLELLKLEELREFTRSARGLESDVGIALNAVEADILAEFVTLVAFGKQVSECEQTSCAQLGQYRQQRQAQATRFDSQVTAFIQTIRDNRQNDDFFYDPRYLNETARDIVAQPGTLLIYPFVTEDKLWLLYTAAGDVAGAVPVEVSQLRLGEAVVRFRDLLEAPDSGLNDLQATGKQLYDWLIAPLEQEIQANGITTLVFSQDRVTRYIPMGALWDGEQYLTQNYTLSTILSAELTDMEDQLSSSPSDTRVFGLGLSDAVLDFDPLPNVESELDAIVRADEADEGIYPGLALLNPDFNRDALITNLPGHRIVHIATHGEFVAGLPEESFLVLGDGSRFSIPDINSLGSDLRDVHLVVLSACETAVGGPAADGIEVAGISSYFLAANRASAVLASLWLVNDASTSMLMQRFYANFAEGTMTKAEALRQAQLSLLNGEANTTPATDRNATGIRINSDRLPQEPTSDFSHPYYWAPFILIGNGL